MCVQITVRWEEGALAEEGRASDPRAVAAWVVDETKLCVCSQAGWPALRKTSVNNAASSVPQCNIINVCARCRFNLFLGCSGLLSLMENGYQVAAESLRCSHVNYLTVLN